MFIAEFHADLLYLVTTNPLEIMEIMENKYQNKAGKKLASF